MKTLAAKLLCTPAVLIKKKEGLGLLQKKQNEV